MARTKRKKKTDAQIQNDYTAHFMDIIDERCSYYRANPHRFVEEYLGIKLKLFQKILLWAMMKYDNFYFVAARGLGKTYLTALFSVVRCILYPWTKIVACSATFKQGKEIILKITDDFMQKSALLRSEISKVSTGQNDCSVQFKNGSIIRVVTATETSRGARSNILIIDESRLVEQKIVDTVLRPMNASPRQPGYLSKPEYADRQEMNKEMYLSSAYYAASEMYQKVKAYAANFLDPDLNYFICDLPYQLSIKEGLLMREQIENEMSEATFSDVSFSMERIGLFWGSSEDALFDYKILNSRRVIMDSLHPLEYYKLSNLKMPEKQGGEIRVLSVDVALMASKKHDNDATALIIHSALPQSNNTYLDNIVYVDTREGLLTDELGLLIMRYFYQYNCDYIVLDANGVGMGAFDYLMSNRYDPVYNEQYSALDCINNSAMSERCKVRGAKKAIYTVKANASFNDSACKTLRNGFLNGNINLLINDDSAERTVKKIRGYSKLPSGVQEQLIMPYLQTTFLINELINLSYEVTSSGIKVREKSGMRKDRYSSLEYGYYLIVELNKNLKPRPSTSESLVTKLAQRMRRSSIC